MKRLILVLSVLATVACAQTAPVLTASFALNTNGVVISPTNFWSANDILATASNDGRFVNSAGDEMTGRLIAPEFQLSFTNLMRIEPGLNLLSHWSPGSVPIQDAIPTNGAGSYDEEQADQVILVDMTTLLWRRFQLLPDGRWLSLQTYQQATTNDTISSSDWAYFKSAATGTVYWTMSDDPAQNVYTTFFGTYPNLRFLDLPMLYRVLNLWTAYKFGPIPSAIYGSNGVAVSRSAGNYTITLDGSVALQAPVRIDATNLTIRVGSRRAIGTNVVETGLAWNETNAATLAWVVVTNGTTNAATVYHSGNFSPGSYLSQSAWAGAQTGLLAFVGAPTSYNAAGSARQVSYGAMNGTNYWFFYSGTNWERIAVGARPW